MAEIMSNEQYGAKFMREGVARRVRRLRDLADRIERDGENGIVRAEAGKGTYGTVASNLLHEVTWGVANLNIETLLATATDADIAHARDK